MAEREKMKGSLVYQLATTNERELIDIVLSTVKRNGFETVQRNADNTLSSLKAKYIVLELGEKITIFEDGTFIHGGF